MSIWKKIFGLPEYVISDGKTVGVTDDGTLTFMFDPKDNSLCVYVSKWNKAFKLDTHEVDLHTLDLTKIGR